ncbi:LOW QUALITY PROTEIN: coiled-coil domain-containing protein 120-like [Polyodon spathula]|uniref:LOW QUALITY PROTEIN: coiled-coil domain-containing protein 120-like n=1 Tax=Polyodon spathula TaxID=7913 RepID=UPI001B7E3660|nr:LOW QUALITY PROTEIN: coiled-coil domain-containing protein 120-like [Polyodon spathula]
MEVKGHLITSTGLGSLDPLFDSPFPPPPPPPDPQSSDLGSKLRSDRVAELLDRKRALQSALRSRLVDLKKLCLQEAELTGELPNEYPLQSGERPPHVRRRLGGSYRIPSTSNAKGEESWLEDMERQFSLQQQIVEAARRLAGGAELGAEQLRTRRQVLSSATRRLQELEELINERRVKLGRKPMQRAAMLLQDDCLHSENSSVSNTTGHESDEPLSSSKPLPDHPSPPKSRLGWGSPDFRVSRQLSPVKVHYEIKTRRSSVASTASPSCTLPRSISMLDVEGRSIPATPLLPRTTHSGGHFRHDTPNGLCLRQWSDTPEGPLPLPLQEETAAVPAGSFERGGFLNGARTHRSNSTEALLDRSAFQEPGGRGIRGPFKSSETLRPPEQGRVRDSVAGRSYNDILLDYVWEKQQQQTGRTWVDFPAASPAPLHRDFAPSPTNHAGFYSGFQNRSGAGNDSPLLRGRGEVRRVKVTRTKSCGPFIPLQQQQQQQQLLDHQLRHHRGGIRDFAEAPSELGGSRGRGEESSHVLHKALALEGLKDWYIRNALAHGRAGQPPQSRGQDFGRRRLYQQPPRQSQSDQYCQDPHQQLSQSLSFHGNPLHIRHLELSLCQDRFDTRLQDMSLAEPGIDMPSPGTLV